MSDESRTRDHFKTQAQRDVEAFARAAAGPPICARNMTGPEADAIERMRRIAEQHADERVREYARRWLARHAPGGPENDTA